MSTRQKNNYIEYIKAILKSQQVFNFSKISASVNQWDLTRLFSKKFDWKKHLWNFFSIFFSMIDAYLVIDDTIIEKPHSAVSRTVGKIVRWVFSHKDNKCIKGIQIVFLLLVVGNFRFPIGFKIYDKSKTKIELAKELLSYARNKLNMKNMFVLFDSWYSSKDFMKFIKNYGWYYVCRVKKNRKIGKLPITQVIKNPYGMINCEIGGMKVLLVRNGKHYLVTNRLSLLRKDVLDLYSKRSSIEEFFRVIKTIFHAKSCQARSIEIWETHLYQVLFCFCLVEQKRIKLGYTIYKAQAEFKLEEYQPLIDGWKEVLENA